MSHSDARAVAAQDVTCGYCGTVFTEDHGQPTCAGCPLNGSCRFVRCPACGYENPLAPDWVSRLRSWLRPAAADPHCAMTPDTRAAHPADTHSTRSCGARGAGPIELDRDARRMVCIR